MDKQYFYKAKPIWAKDKIKEVNTTLVFKSWMELGEYDLVITANNFYRIFINGKFIGYGPARAAHDYYRLDTYHLSLTKPCNIIVIEVNGANCNSFYALNSEPFLQCEIRSNDVVVRYTGKDFKCYNNDFRLAKVVRFSYQRAFSESYRFDSKLYHSFLNKRNSQLTRLEIVQMKDKQLLERIVHYPIYEDVAYKIKEYGYVTLDDSLPLWRDRYMNTKELVIFPIDEWDDNPNDLISRFVPHLGKKIKLLCQNDFVTAFNSTSMTGFISLKLQALEDSDIIIYFDEVNNGDNDVVDIKFYRNTTENFVSYHLNKGKYDLLSFEPYTAKYIRVVVLKGCAKVHYIGIKTYENPDKNNIKYKFKNRKINKVIDAAIATFAQNAVDILSDCPSRERAGWLCDSYFSSKAEQLITGDNLVEQSFLENYSYYKKGICPKNMVPCCYPADFAEPLFIVQWSMWYLLELKDYVIRTGNSINQGSIDNIKSLLVYYQNYENELGLLEDLPGWNFIEWSKANDPEFVKGINYPTNMLYYAALRACAILLNDNQLIFKADKLKQNIINLSFDGTFFHDNSLRKDGEIISTNNITETCQYYAFYFAVADKKHFAKLFNTLKNDFGPNRDDKEVYPQVYKSNVLPGDILRLSILNKHKLFKMTFKESIDYFYKMSQMSGTLWELDDLSASLNHAFTSYIVNLILEANFGLAYIDKKNRIIHMHNHALYQDGEVSIPLGSNLILNLKASNKHLVLTKPDEYQIAYDLD